MLKKLIVNEAALPPTNVPIPTRRRQLQSIQAARGVAALTVVAFHLTLFVKETYPTASLWLNGFSNGFAGVDLFFVISGFVIVYTSHTYLGKPSQLTHYLTKRFVRVYPMYWLSLLAMLLAMSVAYWAGSEALRASMADKWPDLSTFLLTPYHTILNGVSWSLSFELFFYLLFACLIVSRRLWVIPVAFLLGSLYVTFTEPYIVPGLSTPVAVYFWFSSLNIEFALGAVLGMWFTFRPAPVRVGNVPIGSWLVIAGLLWLVALPATPNEHVPERLWHYGIGSFLLLGGLLSLEHSHIIRLPRWVVLTGDASYVIYLIHVPLLLPFGRLMAQTFPIFSPMVSWLCLSFVVIITLLSIGIHKKIEKPLMRRLKSERAKE
jgi:exopolysaccharide production protein ExoZ